MSVVGFAIWTVAGWGLWNWSGRWGWQVMSRACFAFFTPPVILLIAAYKLLKLTA